MNRTRKILMATAGLGLIVCLALWVGIKVGRPIYYTDGNGELAAPTLRHAAMLRWSEPQSELEVPGPVRGRITELPDGKWIYGRAVDQSRTDLVVFDPARPGEAARPVLELNTEGHELAPVLGAGGRLYFASDRPGGPGGFDLYAATYRSGLFYAPEPLPEGINTGLDESDPTVDRQGGQIVFVRRDPELEDGRNGQLVAASFDAPQASAPVFPVEKASSHQRRRTLPIDRDPMLAPDGVGLYFVREVAGRGLELMRTSWHVDHFVPALAVAQLQAGGPYRAPSLIDDGFGMRLVTTKPIRSGDGGSSVTSMVVRAAAQPVYPFWEGQWWLEWLLLYLAGFFALLLLLLTLGARWSQLDVVTKLVLLSALIHLLLLLWLAGVEIVRSFNPRGPDTGAVQVNLVSQRASEGDASASTPTQNEVDVSRDLAFDGFEQSLAPTGPELAMQTSERSLDTKAREARPAMAPAERRENAAVSDRAAAIALRNARSTETEQQRQTVRTRAATSDRTKASRREVAAEEIRVVVPDASSQSLSARDARSAAVSPAPPVARSLPAARARRQLTAVADAPAEPTRRKSGKASGGAADAMRADAGGRVAVANSRARAQRSEGAERSVAVAQPQQNLLAGTAPSRRMTAPAALSGAPEPREVTMRAQDVADAPQINRRPSRAAPAEATLARAERVAGSGMGQTQKDVAVARTERSVGASLVAAPRSELVSESRRRTAPSPTPQRALPRRTEGAVTDDAIAVADTVPESYSVTPRKAARAAESVIARRDLDAMRPGQTADSQQAERDERAAMVAQPVDRPIPESLLARAGARPLPKSSTDDGGAVPPAQGSSMVADLGAVAMQDDAEVPPAAVAKSETGTSTAEPRVAKAELTTVAAPAMATKTDVVRGDPDGVVTQPLDRPDPGSMLARAERRSEAMTRDMLPRAARRRASDPLLADAIELRDAAESAKPSGVASEDRPVEMTRSFLVELEQRQVERVGRPLRDEHTGGFADVSLGLEVPGSFLERAGVRPEVPVVAARTESLTPYSNRFGANKLAALKKYGGTAETERAVAKGLAYLARIQNEDGTWGSPRRNQKKYGEVFIGKTGLCLLAFLGAGHTPDSKTKYSDVARRAVRALLRTQRRSSHFGRTSSYSHGITTYALAECFALTKNENLKEPLESAVRWILANQNRGRDRRSRGGWGYFSSNLRAEDGFARTSTTAWQVMALESAKLSGLEVSDEALAQSKSFLLQSYDRRYRYFLYNKEPSRLRSEWRTLPASTPAAVFCLQLLGMNARDDDRLAAGLEYTLERRPRRYRRYSDDDFVLRGAGNVYFWYYSTLACFMAGGDTWERWNTALKKVLLSGQAADGSFPIIDTYAGYAGDTNRDRSYTTAMCVLSLEVYYRYFTPLLKKDN